MKKWTGFAIALCLMVAWWLIRLTSPATPALSASDLRFADVSDRMAIHFEYQDPDLDPKIKKIQKIFFIGGALAVADVNQDGWMDIFFANSGNNARNHLYLNQNGTRFLEAADTWGIANLNQEGATMVPLIFDYDNDGRPDLFLSRLGCARIFHNTGTRFEDHTAESGINDCQNSSGAISYDFNNDGLLDLYVFRYWGAHNFFSLRSPFVIYENLTNALNGGSNTYYQNIGNGRFKDVTATHGGYDIHWTYDAAVADFEGNGKPYLYLANDFGADALFETTPSGQLINVSEKLGMPDRRLGMSASLGDLDGSGKPHLYVSNEYIPQWNQTGNFLWKFDLTSGKPAEHVDQAPRRQVDNCGWAWGSAFGDFDLDGLQDLYVTNGLISGQSRREYTLAAGTVTSMPGAIMSDYRNWPAVGDRSFQGHQTNCVFLNKGQTFVNVHSAVGLDQSWDGRGAGLIDFDNNGTLDLVVGTQNGPARAHLLKNELPQSKRWIGFQLIGSKSNRDGVGARVKVSQGERKWFRFATGGKTGFHAISDPRLHFGLPNDNSVRAEVRWPSGIVQDLGTLSAGQYHIVTEEGGKTSPL